ncbi:hypothetical protein [Pseudobacteriovorax antillogorgiicola]|uniref:Uncharacterized protein n=1 Tax=Pseudobacteriovorax antillogorgiicola TaxID=1513793 RepID=A0A1Y6CCA9_9BACT|nr:hypothetical protein [Pseudobacteriovorax antillogorgiicola]TCS48592.1 hypothetical protein EDD56_11714 [Pseudobacteriovorax antillogorgiicola]SMF55638.1 hypothetical protein SAMN06296036_117145 [Pseudobacteriovorax antillogorgiicola]
MFIAVTRIVFEDQQTTYDKRELKALTEKIKSRFHVCVKINKPQEAGIPAIVISALEHSQNQLDQKLDRIADFCEESGFGRIDSEETFFEHIDNLFEP